jgi:putative phosphoribosyl transferase
VGASEEETRAAVSEKLEQVEMRRDRFHRGLPALDVADRTVIVVDDGIATGSTARAALRAIRRRKPEHLVLAVPVAPEDSLLSLRAEADEIVCLERTKEFWAVGAWYDEFPPISDKEAMALLQGAPVSGPLPRPTESEKVPREVVRRVEIDIEGATLVGDMALPAEPLGLVLFAHGSGSSRMSPRNRQVAAALRRAGLGTLLFDLLTTQEEKEDQVDAHVRFDIGLLAQRLASATDWVRRQLDIGALQIGYFGASTGAAAALLAAVQRPFVSVVVSRGGRPDLAGPALAHVTAPTLLIVGGADPAVLALNRSALAQLGGPKRLEVVRGATHLFVEPGALEEVARLATDWFVEHMAPAPTRRARA